MRVKLQLVMCSDDGYEETATDIVTLQWTNNDTMWQEMGSGVDIDAFLRTHQLILGN